MEKTFIAPMVGVSTTTDYGIFKSLSGNRTLNKAHLNRLMKSIQSRPLFTVITVNENYEIIDGQHRFEVFKTLKMPINYIVVPGYGLREVQILNENNKTWNADDYMNAYCDLGYPEYTLYRNFKSKYGFGHHECMTILSGGRTRDSGFYTGTFKVKNFKTACANADKIMMLEPYYSGYRRRSFIYAMLVLFKHHNFEFTQLIAKLKHQPTALQDCATAEQYLVLIEEIYNYKSRNKVSLRF